MTTTSRVSRPSTPTAALNVAQRFAQAVGTAREMGFEVRKVVLDEQTPGWCEVGGRKILFLDITADTAEQLTQIDEIIASFCNHRRARSEGKMAA